MAHEYFFLSHPITGFNISQSPYEDSVEMSERDVIKLLIDYNDCSLVGHCRFSSAIATAHWERFGHALSRI